MTVQLVTKINRYIGTAAEIAAMTLTGIPAGSTFFESDTGILKILNAAGALVNAPSESVALSGSNMDLRGTAATKPLATAVTIGATYWSVDTDPYADAIEVSNGTDWVVI